MVYSADRHGAADMTRRSSPGLARSHGRSSGPGSQAGIERRSARGDLGYPRSTGFPFRWSTGTGVREYGSNVWRTHATFVILAS